MPERVSKMTCAKYKKKGHFAFNCPPKYNNKVRKIQQKKPSSPYNSEDKSITQNEQAAHVNEFAGYTHQITNKTEKNKTWNSSKSFLHHKLRISKFYKQKDDFYAKRKFYRLIFQDDMNLYKTIMKEIRKLGQTIKVQYYGY